MTIVQKIYYSFLIQSMDCQEKFLTITHRKNLSLIHILFFALLKSGDHVIFSSVTYMAVYRLLNELLNNKFGVETTIVDTSDPENVRKAIRPNTKLIHNSILL